MISDENVLGVLLFYNSFSSWCHLFLVPIYALKKSKSSDSIASAIQPHPACLVESVFCWHCSSLVLVQDVVNRQPNGRVESWGDFGPSLFSICRQSMLKHWYCERVGFVLPLQIVF